MAGLPRILVVDDSRVVRASLVHHLKGEYEVLEEGDGDAAWQTLVLDHSIRAVISDLQMPKVDGYELLERLRSSRLRRLLELPFILVSGLENEDELARAREKGASDFVSKGACSTEILARLNNLLALSEARENLAEGREQLAQNPVSGLYTRKYLELQAAQSLSHAARHGQDISVMVLGFDGFDRLTARLGAEKAEDVGTRLARMLAGKMRQEDSLGHFGPGQYAVVSPGTPPAFCATFAERVRSAVEAARLTFHGELIALTVSIGVSSVPRDAVVSAAALLELAGQRMQAAAQAGGNRIDAGGSQPATQVISVHQALRLIAADRPAAVVPHLPVLAESLLPLLQLMNQELGLALPLADVERRLSERKNGKI